MAEETCLRTPGETSGVIMVGNFPQPTSDQYCVTLECQRGSLAQTALSSRNRCVPGAEMPCMLRPMIPHRNAPKKRRAAT